MAGGLGPLIVCGRFEGVDQRVIEARHLEEVSIGDYVLSGGEIAGVVGALISVPAVATLRILWRRLTSEKGADAPIVPIPVEKSPR